MHNCSALGNPSVKVALVSDPCFPDQVHLGLEGGNPWSGILLILLFYLVYG